MTRVQLVLIVNPELAEALHDWLLQQGEVDGFSEQPVLAHSRTLTGLSSAEEVRAHRQRVMFQVLTDAQLARQLLADLAAKWPGASIDYVITPVAEAGTLGPRPAGKGQI